MRINSEKQLFPARPRPGFSAPMPTCLDVSSLTDPSWMVVPGTLKLLDLSRESDAEVVRMVFPPACLSDDERDVLWTLVLE